MTNLPVAPAHHAAPTTHELRAISKGLGARLAAFGIDIAAFVIAAPVLLGACAVLLRDLWALGAIAIVASYVAACWGVSGQTLGMRVMGIRLLDERTGQRPSMSQALMRTALTMPPLVGGAVLLNAVLAPDATPLPDPLALLARAAFAMGAISTAFSFFDHGRMLHDRLSATLMVREARHPEAQLRR